MFKTKNMLLNLVYLEIDYTPGVFFQASNPPNLPSFFSKSPLKEHIYIYIYIYILTCRRKTEPPKKNVVDKLLVLNFLTPKKPTWWNLGGKTCDPNRKKKPTTFIVVKPFPLRITSQNLLGSFGHPSVQGLAHLMVFPISSLYLRNGIFNPPLNDP